MVAQRPEDRGEIQTTQAHSCPQWLHGIALAKRLQKHASQGDPGAVDAIAPRIRHPNSSVRLAAVHALRHVANKLDSCVLEDLLGQNIASSGFGLDDVSCEVRVAAAEAVGEIAEDSAHRRSCQKLLQLFEDEDWHVRSAAQKALVKVSHKDAECHWIKNELISLLHGQKWSAKVLAAEGLGHLARRGDEEVVHSLVQASANQDWAVRKASAWALGKTAPVGDSDSLQAVVTLVGSQPWHQAQTSSCPSPESPP
mmetsp:Transcript_32723/g.51036  ORF Transcript_32723/g.51036 Transcript_32723/m.51036 type:complete len:254 (-) Transcript_32723:798-1559(-)